MVNKLLPVPGTDPDNYTSIFQRLQLLRDRAHVWSKLDIYSCRKIIIPEKFRYGTKSTVKVANGHLCLWDDSEDLVMVFPILPKVSQQTITREWSPRSLRSDPDAHTFDVFMDPAQNLIAVAYAITADDLQSGNESFYVDIGTLNGGGIHPKAAGQTLLLLDLGYENGLIETDPEFFKLKGLGRHVAFWRSLLVSDTTSTHVCSLRELQIWDWRRSTTSNVSLGQKY